MKMKTKSIKETNQLKPNFPFFASKANPGFWGVQPKIVTGTPGDKYEQEADFVASEVVKHIEYGNGQFIGPANPVFSNEYNGHIQDKPLSESVTPLIQKQEEGEEEEIQAKLSTGYEGPEDEAFMRGMVEEEEEVQAKSIGEVLISPTIEKNLKSSSAAGSKLDSSTLAEMENGFGADFSSVNIHTDQKAVQMNKELGAQAFTYGHDIYFNHGKYNPHTQDGKNLLAHELTHTIQQTGMVPANLQFTIGDGHDLSSPRFAGNHVLEACYDNERILQSGASGTAVTLIQQALIDAGFPLPRFGADGIFGNETRQALMDFQRSSSLVVDGKLGPATMSALDALFSGGTPPTPVTPQPATPPNITTETVKAAPDGTANTRTIVGVGEHVRLRSDTSGTWTVSHGRIIGLNTGSSILWEAPAIGSSATITVTAPGGSSTVPITVIAPNVLTMTVNRHDPIPAGTAGACMILDVVVNPRHVNFGRTQWLEVPGPATNVTGYFNRFSAATIFHNPNPNYLPFNDNNSGLQDHAAWHAVPAPFSFGTFDWVIPNRYKIDGEADSRGRFFTNTLQAFTMFPGGTMMINKAGSTVIRFMNNTII